MKSRIFKSVSPEFSGHIFNSINGETEPLVEAQYEKIENRPTFRGWVSNIVSSSECEKLISLKILAEQNDPIPLATLIRQQNFEIASLTEKLLEAVKSLCKLNEMREYDEAFQKERASTALSSLDDFARMNVGVNPIGPRTVLEKFISRDVSIEKIRTPSTQTD